MNNVNSHRLEINGGRFSAKHNVTYKLERATDQAAWLIREEVGGRKGDQKIASISYDTKKGSLFMVALSNCIVHIDHWCDLVNFIHQSVSIQVKLNNTLEKKNPKNILVTEFGYAICTDMFKLTNGEEYWLEKHGTNKLFVMQLIRRTDGSTEGHFYTEVKLAGDFGLYLQFSASVYQKPELLSAIMDHVRLPVVTEKPVEVAWIDCGNGWSINPAEFGVPGYPDVVCKLVRGKTSVHPMDLHLSKTNMPSSSYIIHLRDDGRKEASFSGSLHSTFETPFLESLGIAVEKMINRADKPEEAAHLKKADEWLDKNPKTDLIRCGNFWVNTAKFQLNGYPNVTCQLRESKLIEGLPIDVVITQFNHAKHTYSVIPYHRALDNTYGFVLHKSAENTYTSQFLEKLRSELEVRINRIDEEKQPAKAEPCRVTSLEKEVAALKETCSTLQKELKTHQEGYSRFLSRMVGWPG